MKNPSRIVLCKERPYNLIDVYAIIQSFCNHESFLKLSLSMLLVLVKQQGKLQKYFDLLAFN